MIITDYIDYRSGQLWVTESFLAEELPCAPWQISINTIRNGTRKYRKHQSSDRWENHPHIKLQRQVLINFDTIDFEEIRPFKGTNLDIPDKATLINLWQSAKQADREAAQVGLIDDLDERWMAYYQGPDERYYQSKFGVNRAKGDTRANHLAQSVAILRLLASGELCGFSNKKDLQTAIAQRVKELELYGKGLNSYDRVRKTLTAYRKSLKDSDQDERDVVVSGHYGNEKAQKFDDLHRTVMLRYYLGLVHQQKPDKWAAWRDYYNFMITEGGCAPHETIKYARFKQITLEKSIEDMAAAIRHGGAAYEAFIRPFVLRQEMLYSNTLVAGDGWEPGHSAKFRWFDPKKKRWINRTGTMNVWLWYDWKSKAILSHNIAGFENSHQIRMSFRDIIGLHGSCPRAVMVDKKWQDQSDTSRMFEKAGLFIAGKKAHSPWTSIAERNNKEMNKLHRYLDEFWVNMTQNHSLQSQHNEEKIRGGKSKFFEEKQESGKHLEEAELRALVLKIIERYNHTPVKSLGGRTPMEVYEASKDPKCTKPDPLDLMWMFGETTVAKTHNYNVKIKIASVEHTFLIRPEDINTYRKASPKHNRVRIYYDERHLESVDLYSYTDKEDQAGDAYICSAINSDRVRVDPINLDDAEGHDAKLGWQKKRGDTVDQLIKDELQYMDEIDETMGWDTATYMSMSQDQYKAAHSNAVAKKYTSYHQEREAWEGHRVLQESADPVTVMTDDEKYELRKAQRNGQK